MEHYEEDRNAAASAGTGSVRGRLILSIGAACLVVCLLLLGLSVVAERRSLIERSVFQASIVAQSLSTQRDEPTGLAEAAQALEAEGVVSVQRAPGTGVAPQPEAPRGQYRISENTLLYDAHGLSVAIDLAGTTAALRSHLARMVALAVVLIVVLTTFSYLGLRPALLVPLRAVDRRMRSISQGEADLSERIAVSRNDEIGRISASFDAFSERLQTLVRDIKRTSSDMLDGARRLSATSHDTLERVTENSASVDETKDRLGALNTSIAGVAGSVDRIGTSIEALDQAVFQQSDAIANSLAAVEEMDASIRSLDSVVRRNKSLTDTLVDLANTAAEQMEGAVQSIATVESSTEDMLEMITIVDSVAEQTNLLAMNAAIEAAHAGEYGKGFAVVANEIRNLSVLSSENAQKINKNLREDVDSIHRAGEVNRSAREAFERITGHVGEVADGMSQVLASLDEQAAASSEIVNGFSTVRNVTETVRSGTKGIADEAATIKSDTDSVSDSSARAEEQMVAVAERIAGIRDAISSVNQIVDANQQRMQHLIGILGTFRIDTTES